MAASLPSPITPPTGSQCSHCLGNTIFLKIFIIKSDKFYKYPCCKFIATFFNCDKQFSQDHLTPPLKNDKSSGLDGVSGTLNNQETYNTSMSQYELVFCCGWRHTLWLFGFRLREVSKTHTEWDMRNTLSNEQNCQ